MEAKIGKSYLTEIPHKGSKITFQYPAFRGCYRNVADAIDKEGLKRPNSSETASLIYDAWKDPKEKYSAEIISILEDNLLWEYTGNFYFPKSNEEINNGVILDTNSQGLKFVNGKLDMNKNDLIKRLKENDSSVKFVPFGYKTGEQNLIELQKNPYIKARYGEEGAEKIAEIALKYKNKPFVNVFNSVNEEKIRVSALNWFRSLSNRLFVIGDDWDDDVDSFAFGIVKEK